MGNIFERIILFIFGFYKARYSFGIKNISGNKFEISDPNNGVITFYSIQPSIIFGKDNIDRDYKIQKPIYEKLRQYDHKLIFIDYGDTYEYAVYFKNKHDLQEFTWDDE